MSTLSGVRHTVRSSAARTRRTLLWTPRRFRLTITGALAVLVLVPVGSLAVRQPWTRVPGPVTTAGSTAGVPAQDGLGGGTVGNGLAGGPAPLPTDVATVPGVPGATAPAATGTPVDGGTAPADGEGLTPADGPVDAAPLPVTAVLAVASSRPLPSRSAGGGQTLSPGAATDRWKAQARTTAVRFSQAWLDGATASRVDTWVRSLDPWLDPAARDVVALTNLAQIPRTSAATVQLLTLAESDATAQVRLGDGGRLDLVLEWDGDTWRVTSYEPVPASVAAPSSSPATSPGAGGTP